MRYLLAGLFAILILMPAEAARLQSGDLYSPETVLRWINAYRDRPDAASVPAAMRALSRFGTFRDPERAGTYVGFLAGVIAANPRQAEKLIDKTLAMQGEDHWVVVRAIAYSGRPEWKQLLRRFAHRMPTRKVMIAKYLSGDLPTLDKLEIAPSPTTWQRLRSKLRVRKPPRRVVLEPAPDVLDTLWGYYFATGSYGPIMHLVAMLPWSKDRDSTEKLTLGMMAKYTLANNAIRDTALLAMLKNSTSARDQNKETVAVLKEVIEAAETVDTARIRSQALAAIAELQRKGPGYRRDLSTWGQVGTGALALGCIAAAATAQVEFGLPCVIGGGLSTAAMNYWNRQQ
jgi:hypothetical protein